MSLCCYLSIGSVVIVLAFEFSKFVIRLLQGRSDMLAGGVFVNRS